jgi:3-hydroxyisobutyrate dehydrogenase-like beta-hydroxyacid dehydrogenase
VSADVRPWGFIGLGEMGAPMVDNLLRQGVDVVAFDRDASRVTAACERGARGAASVSSMMRAADVVSVCVRDGAQLHALLDDGLDEHASERTVLLVHSTIGAAACRALGERLAVRGAVVLDAPISGMRLAAEQGTLAFFVGGSSDALERVRHGLDAMGRVVIHVGDVGAGQAVKIANNLVAFGTAGLVHEATELARLAGVDEERVIEALAVASARSWVVEHWSFLRREWIRSQPGGAAAVREIVSKDLSLATGAAKEAGIPAPFAEVAERVVPPVLAGGPGTW